MHPETLTEAVAAEIRVHLARQRRRGTDLAEFLGISTAAVSAKLNDKTPFTLTEVERIAEWLQVPVRELLGERAGA